MLNKNTFFKNGEQEGKTSPFWGMGINGWGEDIRKVVKG
jgi:hypothetical protein